MATGNNSEKGNILATSLLVMLAMNLLAVTLVQTSLRESKTADFKVTDSSIFYLAESCISDSVDWFKGFSTPPSSQLPYTITRANISNLYVGNETQAMLNIMSKYSYNCTTSALTTKSVQASETGLGNNVGNTDAYGISGDLRPVYYYKIESNGNGPSNTKKKLTTIVSVQY